MCNHKFVCWLLVLIISSSIGGKVTGQEVNFIHLQTENTQSFQLRWNRNNYSSSSTGYLVIPQVLAGAHQLFLTFPPDLTSEYSFTIIVTDKPRGFSLRWGIDNGWTLFDMIDFSLLKGTAVVKVPQPEVIAKVIEPFASPSTIVKAKEAISQTETMAKLKPSISQPLSENKSGVVLPNASAEMPILLKARPVNNKSSLLKSLSIRKIFDKAGSTGIDQVFIVFNEGTADTVAIFIPDLKEVFSKAIQQYQIAYQKNPLPFSAKTSYLLACYPSVLNGRLSKSLLSK